ncbi:MAG: exodeoxyribonuclease VII small subunit [Lachnospiraceae bacterium]|nr:exodeoxyribonuclease VII small subunit [Lachnospiraceae bacterium]
MPAKKENAAGNSRQSDINEQEKMTLEDAFAALDDIVNAMEDEKISLEDSFKNYKKGLELIKYCNDSIGTIEGELEVLESGD